MRAAITSAAPPTRTRPAARGVALASALRSCSTGGPIRRASASAIAVGVTPARDRTKSGPPTSASSRRSRAETAGWDTPSARAAALTERVR